MKHWMIRGLFLVLILSCMACVDTPSITGSHDVDEFTDVVFEITEMRTTSSALIVEGTIENTGNTTFPSPWYIEGEFYENDDYIFKFGGDYFMVAFPLAPGEQTAWELSFSSHLYEEGDYPDFAVKHLRAYAND